MKRQEKFQLAGHRGGTVFEQKDAEQTAKLAFCFCVKSFIYITVDSFPFPVYGSHVPLQASSPFVIAGLLLPFFSLTSGSPLLAVPAENNGHCAQSTRKNT